MQMQLLKKEAESYKDEVKEIHNKMEEENMRLSSDLAELRLQEEAARMRVQETERERAALETRVAVLQAKVESGRREREEEVASHKRQLINARRQQDMVEEELKVVWKEMGEKQERWACGEIWYSMYIIHGWMFFFVENPDLLHLTVMAIIYFASLICLCMQYKQNVSKCGMCVSVHV